MGFKPTTRQFEMCNIHLHAQCTVLHSRKMQFFTQCGFSQSYCILTTHTIYQHDHVYIIQTWFTVLPPILVLELSRFSFNQTSSMAEKLHSRLSFDLTLSMDRYLERNCGEVRKRRKEVATLKHKLAELRRRLTRCVGLYTYTVLKYVCASVHVVVYVYVCVEGLEPRLILFH